MPLFLLFEISLEILALPWREKTVTEMPKHMWGCLARLDPGKRIDTGDLFGHRRFGCEEG